MGEKTGEERGLERRRDKERLEGGSRDSKLSFFNHSTVCSIKVQPIARQSATFSQLPLGEPISRLLWKYQ